MNLTIRALGTIASTVAAVLITLGSPVAAAQGPRADEWWFRTWSIQKIWHITKGAGVTVAVIDSGVKANLPDLAGRVLPGMTIGGRGDGRKDIDQDGHGTAMAALIAARGTGPSGFMGIAPEAKILPVSVPQAQMGNADAQFMARGIRFAADHGARVINLSIGQWSELAPGHCQQVLQDAVAYAAQRDVIVVAAVGNDGGPGFNPHVQPAACAGVVAVGAVDSAARPWAKSQRIDSVTVAGPGVGIGWVGTDGKYYPNGSGTSEAAALTSGGLALVRAAHPEWSARTVVQRMIATANPTSSPGWNNQTGYGAFRIHRALDATAYPVAADAPDPVYQRLEQHAARQPPPPTAPGPTAASHPRQNSLSVTTLIAVSVAVTVAILAAVLFTLWARRRPSPVTYTE